MAINHSPIIASPQHLFKNKSVLLFILVIIGILFVLLLIQQHESRGVIPSILTPSEEEAFLLNYFESKKKGSGVDASSCSIEPNEGTLTREMLGPHVWNVFHAYAENAQDYEQEKLLKWIQLTAELFPCKECSNDFQNILAKFPYKGNEQHYNSKSQWMCKLHNLVNKKTHKKTLFDCDPHHLHVTYKLKSCGTEEELKDGKV